MTRGSGLQLSLLRKSVASARRQLLGFGLRPVTTADTTRLLDHHHVRVLLSDLPQQKGAALSPPLFGRHRVLCLATHVPRLSRQLVLLHEAGHLCQGTAADGITYDSSDWTSSVEQAADAFAAVGLIPTPFVDDLLSSEIWTRSIEDVIAEELMWRAAGLWEPERALFVARNRLRVREVIGV